MERQERRKHSSAEQPTEIFHAFAGGTTRIPEEKLNFDTISTMKYAGSDVHICQLFHHSMTTKGPSTISAFSQNTLKIPAKDKENGKSTRLDLPRKTYSDSSRAFENRWYRLEEDFDIKPNRPLVDITHIQRHPFIEAD
jgi:hypothetical protein